MEDVKKHILIILGRPFSATIDAPIQCRTGNMQLFFDNIYMELNIFNIVKQSQNRDNGIVNVDLIEELVYCHFPFNFGDDPLQICLTYFVWILILIDQLIRSMPHLTHHKMTRPNPQVESI